MLVIVAMILRKRSKQKMGIVSCLSSLPVNDGNFKSALCRASDEEIRKAVEIMIYSGRKHKGRILACERELRKRGKNQ